MNKDSKTNNINNKENVKFAFELEAMKAWADADPEKRSVVAIVADRDTKNVSAMMSGKRGNIVDAFASALVDGSLTELPDILKDAKAKELAFRLKELVDRFVSDIAQSAQKGNADTEGGENENAKD